MKKLIISALATLAMAGSANAQGFANGGITLSYESFTFSGGLERVSDSGLGGFAIFELGSAFDVQIGASLMNIVYNSSNTYSDTNVNIHGIYNISPALRAGVVYSTSTQWETNTDGITSYGVELQYDLGAFMIEAQAGATEVFNDDATFASVRANYDFGVVGIDGIYSFLTVDSGSGSMLALRANYEVAALYNAELFGQVSFMSDSFGSPSETYFEVGVTIPFGTGGKEPFSDPNNAIRAFHLYFD